MVSKESKQLAKWHRAVEKLSKKDRKRLNKRLNEAEVIIEEVRKELYNLVAIPNKKS